jgi:DNA invertase Pin-like site-specific DNA recombinase
MSLHASYNEVQKEIAQAEARLERLRAIRANLEALGAGPSRAESRAPNLKETGKAKPQRRSTLPTPEEKKEEVVKLHEAGTLTLAQIANKAGLSLSTVNRIVKKAKVVEPPQSTPLAVVGAQ